MARLVLKLGTKTLPVARNVNLPFVGILSIRKRNRRHHLCVCVSTSLYHLCIDKIVSQFCHRQKLESVCPG